MKKEVSSKKTNKVPKSKKAEVQAGNLRELILDESIKIISESGVLSLSLREVARKLGVSHGAPYRHFPTKDDLLAGIAAKGFKLFTEYLKEGLKEPDNLEISLNGFLRMKSNYLKFAHENPDLFKFIFSASVPNDPKYEDLHHWSKASFEVLMRQLTSLREFGVLKKGNLFECAMFCSITMQGLALNQINHISDYLSLKYEYSGNLLDYLDTYILSGMNAILEKKSNV